VKILGLDGKVKKLSLHGSRVSSNDARIRSTYHLAARQLIKELFSDFVGEEVFIPGEGFYFDFFLPTRRMVVEVHGEQHYKFTPFFHKTKLDFVKQKKTDKLKGEFCRLNGFTYIELPYTETIEQWTARLLNY